jgi:outer membrane protein OmpU
MGNQLSFTGGGELDNGLTVAISFVLDQGDGVTAGTAPFDSHSISISSDALGTFKMHGEGGSSAQAAIDTTAAGDIWDTFDGTTTGTTVSSSESGADIMVYTLPTMVDSLSVSASYSPQQATAASSTAWAATYTGVEGLSVSYGQGENGSTATGAEGDVTTMKGSYAMGSFTAAYSNTESDKSGTGTDEEMTSYKLSYTVTDDLSVSYGAEAHETSGQSIDEEFEAITVSYTTGGMTITAGQYDAKNLANTSGNTAERWKLGASFAF